MQYRIPLRLYVLDTTLCDKVCQWLALDFLHEKNWPLRYNWNVVESGVKHHKSKPNIVGDNRLVARVILKLIKCDMVGGGGWRWWIY